MKGFFNSLSIKKSANSFGFKDNCYYCTVAALLGTTTDKLVDQSETMQDKTANIKETTKLFENVGKYVNITESSYAKGIHDQLLNLQIGAAVALGYKRANNTDHMLVAKRDKEGIKCIDYQLSPPKVTGFPPEQNIWSYVIIFKL